MGDEGNGCLRSSHKGGFGLGETNWAWGEKRRKGSRVSGASFLRSRSSFSSLPLPPPFYNRRLTASDDQRIEVGDSSVGDGLSEAEQDDGPKSRLLQRFEDMRQLEFPGLLPLLILGESNEDTILLFRLGM